MILTGVYRAGFPSPNVTALTVAAVPRHNELPPLAEVGGGGGGLGGGLHGQVVQVQGQLAVGHTALTTNCLRQQPQLSWGQGDVSNVLYFPNVQNKMLLLHTFIAFLPEVGKISGSFLACSGRAGGHRMPEMDVEMRRAVPIFESANAFTQNHFNL